MKWKESIWLGVVGAFAAICVVATIVNAAGKVDKLMGGVFRENDADDVTNTTVTAGDGVTVTTSGVDRAVAVDSSVARRDAVNEFTGTTNSFTGGNVGIGTSTPSNALEVSGGNIALDNKKGVEIKDAAGTDRLVLSVNAGDNVTIGQANLDDIIFYVGTTGAVMYVKDATGRVGINTANPATLLDVNGTSTFRGHVLPGSSNVYDLGSSTYPFRTAYLGPQSLYLGTNKVQVTGTALEVVQGGTSNIVPYLGGAGASTNLSDYNNDAGFVLADVAASGTGTNLSDYTNDSGYTLPDVAASGTGTNVSDYANDAGYRVLADVATNVYNLTIQDPTNGIAYYLPNPFNANVTLAEVFVQTHGMTGNVDVIQRARTTAWYTYSTTQADIVADTDGTSQTSFSGSTTWTNTGRLGFIPTDLSAFATTNLISVDFKVTR